MTPSVELQLPNAIAARLRIKDHSVQKDPFEFLEGLELDYGRDHEPGRYLDDAPEQFGYEMPLNDSLDDRYIEPNFNF